MNSNSVTNIQNQIGEEDESVYPIRQVVESNIHEAKSEKGQRIENNIAKVEPYIRIFYKSQFNPFIKDST